MSTYLLREWAMVFVTFPLLILPGLGLAYEVARRRNWGLIWAVLLSVGFTFALDAALEMVAYYLGLGLTFVTWGHALAAAGSCLWLLWKRPALPDGDGHGLSGLVLSAIAAVTALIQQPWWFGTPDTYYHLAAARSVDVANLPLVTDPFFGIGSEIIDATSGSLHPVMAVISRLSDTDVATGYASLTAFGAALLVLAFWTLSHELSSNRRIADLATVAYVIGAWFTDFRAFAYPKQLSLGLAFIAIALIVRLARGKDRRAFVSLCAVGFGTLAMHLGSAELVLLVGLAVAIGSLVAGALETRAPGRREWRAGAARIMAAMLMIVILAMPVLYPRIVSLGGTSVLGSDSIRNAEANIIDLPLGMRIMVPGGFGYEDAAVIWMTILITAVLAWKALRTRQKDEVVLLSILLLVPALTVFPATATPALDLSSYMVMRMLQLLRFTPYLALGWAVAAYAADRRLWRGALVFGSVLAIAVVSASFIRTTYVQWEGGLVYGKHVCSIATSQEYDLRTAFGRDIIDVVRDEAGSSYARVMASQISGYHLMGLADITIVASMPTHSPVFMPVDEAESRRADVDRFFTPGTAASVRARLAEKYDVDYIFVSDVVDSRTVREEIVSQRDVFEPVHIGDRAVLLRLVD
ncbi:MAG: hypothetical protein ACYDHQ_09095 [Coriobacteriia bacterium]